MHHVCFERRKFLESVALESNLEARLVIFTWTERGRADPSFLGGVQVLLELAQPPIVDSLSFLLPLCVNGLSLIILVIANDRAASPEILEYRVLNGDYCAIFIQFN